jgi:hypothetical protein
VLGSTTGEEMQEEGKATGQARARARAKAMKREDGAMERFSGQEIKRHLIRR